jgi:hypothetical protein
MPFAVTLPVKNSIYRLPPEMTTLQPDIADYSKPGTGLSRMVTS